MLNSSLFPLPAEGFHKCLRIRSVITKLEGGLVAEGARGLSSAAGVRLPAVGGLRKYIFPCETMHDSQLHDMQAMVKPARCHRQTRARLLVERPEAEVIALQIVKQGPDRARI